MAIAPFRKLPWLVLLATLAVVPANRAAAGTTGALIGDVVTAGGAPIPFAKVTATSPSQAAATVADYAGHFALVALAPDEYTVTVSKEGYQTVSRAGIDVVADNIQSVRLEMQRAVKTLGTVVVREARGLVSPGTVPDVYSVTSQMQSNLSPLGGGGDLDFAYSAIAGVPGAFMPPWQSGWNQPIFIRGGAFNEVGYELDGVPVNRSFDNLLATNLATLGQREVQVYSGSAPANAESHGLSGYVNQVIKTGTYPGFADITASVGAPTFYNKFNIEVGGATPDRNFSYFIGVGGFDQGYRYVDQFNGAAYSQLFGTPFDLAAAPCFGPNPSVSAACYANHAFFGFLPAGPGGYVLGPWVTGQAGGQSHNSHISDRENIVNLHFAVPYRNGKERDDIQLLYDTSELYTRVYSTYLDWGGAPLWSGVDAAAGGIFHAGGHPVFVTGFGYTGALGQPVSGAGGSPIPGVIPYLFPGEPGVGVDSPIPAAEKDGSDNGLTIVKLQYQHDFGSSAFVRIYGYSYYSNYFVHSPNAQNQVFVSNQADRERWTHTRGVAVNYVGQLNPAHLFTLEAAYATAKTSNFDNQQPTNAPPPPPFFNPQSAFAVLVSAANPTSGVCYNLNGGSPTPASCEPATVNFAPFFAPTALAPASFLTYLSPFVAPPAGFEWLAVENGPLGPINRVSPRFTSLSVQDQWRPSDRLHIDYGLRYDGFRFGLAPTPGGITRPLWFNAWNTVMCANPLVNGGDPLDETLFGLPPGTPCSLIGAGWTNAILTNSTASGKPTVYNVLEPRLGGTYTVGAEDVVRLSYGKYAQPPAAEFEQYDTAQQNLPAFIGSLWFKLGYTTPEHGVRPSISYNLDASWEHHFRGSDASFKLTPFYRVTRDQVQEFFIAPTTGTTSGVNAGRQTSFGAEFLLSKGDFSKNGWSGRLSYTYTHSRIRYDALPNGTTPLSGVNGSIQLYNSYTKACAGAVPSTDPRSLCGISGGANAVPTELATGIANPYFRAPAQPLLDPLGSYPTYFVVPTGLQLSSVSYGVPDFATLLVSYKRDRWTFAPVVQYIAGSRYGAPQQQIGVDPATCKPLGTTPGVGGDPRYPFGGAGVPYDATTCNGTITIPDQFSGKFDSPGTFREPSFVTAHLQIGYEVSSRTALRLTLTNVYARCFGGDQLPWSINDGHTCGYDVIPGHVPPVGNIYNPGDPIQRLVRFPYGNLFATQPVNAYLSVEIKL